MKTNSVKLEFGFGVGYDADHRALTPAVLEAGLEQIKAVAVALWGAYTITATNGGWTSPAGTLAEEPGYTLTILTRTNKRYHLFMIDAIKNNLRQEAVAFTQTAVNFQIL